MVDLRPYQIEGIEKIEATWKSGVRRVMFQMPTGTGKTVVFNQIVKQELEQNSTSTVLILAHRQELIEQNVERLRVDFQIEAGMIMGDNLVNLALPVQVASIQTLSKRDYPSLNPSLIIIDEAHHVEAASYKKLLSEYPDARVLGVTASPTRLSGEGFTDSFDKLITSKSIADFIKDEHLADIQYIGRRQIWSKLDLSSISINNTGDYDPNQLSLMMQQDFVMANLIQSYVKYAEKKKMIVFAVNVEHSKYIVKRYEEAGFRAAHLDADTTPCNRKEIINKFKTGKIQILSNVDIVSEGFDVPDCEVVQLARPTKSLVKYLQQIGRCMRPSKTTNKTHCIVLDNVGLYQEFGSPRDPRDWTLEATPKHLRNSSSSSRNSEPRFRTNPEETDEDLIILEDVDMPYENETIAELLSKIDDELTEVSTDTDNSDTIAILRTIKANIASFLRLPCYDVLGNVPADLSIKLFIPSKDNTSVLSGTESLWRSVSFVADFTLPTKSIKPDKPVKPDPSIGKDKQEYYDLLEIWSDWDTTPEALANKEIDSIATILLQHDIRRKYERLQHVISFVKSHDASMFVHQEELDLWELPQTVRTKILDIFKASFAASPKLLLTGTTIDLDISVANLDSIAGIDAIIAVKNTAPSASYAFMNKEILGSVLEAIRTDCNGKTLLKVITRLDTHAGGSKNSTTIVANLKQLHGIAPSKPRRLRRS